MWEHLSHGGCLPIHVHPIAGTREEKGNGGLDDCGKPWQSHPPFLVQRILAGSPDGFREAAGPAAAPRGEEAGTQQVPSERKASGVPRGCPGGCQRAEGMGGPRRGRRLSLGSHLHREAGPQMVKDWGLGSGFSTESPGL